MTSLAVPAATGALERRSEVLSSTNQLKIASLMNQKATLAERSSEVVRQSETIKIKLGLAGQRPVTDNPKKSFLDFFNRIQELNIEKDHA